LSVYRSASLLLFPRQVFTDFSLRVEAGSTLALVGQSGSGKSTIVAILERFYEPQSGQVSLESKRSLSGRCATAVLTRHLHAVCVLTAMP